GDNDASPPVVLYDSNDAHGSGAAYESTNHGEGVGLESSGEHQRSPAHPGAARCGCNARERSPLRRIEKGQVTPATGTRRETHRGTQQGGRMPTVPAAGSRPSNPVDSSTAQAATPTLDYSDFLQLMVAQLQNQDPLNPTDSSEFMSQIAEFSNVEQGINANSKLDQLLVNSNISQASTMIG